MGEHTYPTLVLEDAQEWSTLFYAGPRAERSCRDARLFHLLLILTQIKEIEMGRSDDKRDKLILRLGWVVVVITLVVGASHWLLGFPSNRAMPIFYWAFMIVCVVGLINALGFLDRDKS
jgi:hypothetical protein